MSVQTEAYTWLANKKRAVVVLQILFALGTIACGAANLAMNSRDIGFKYTQFVTKKEIAYYRPYNNHGGDASETTTKPPPVVVVTHREDLIDKLCWDNSGLWGGAIVLLTVLITMRSANSSFLSVCQSVFWLLGFLVCLLTGVAGTIWSVLAIENLNGLNYGYRNKFRDEYNYEATTFRLDSENMWYAKLIVVATTATAVSSYLNVILFIAPLFLDRCQEGDRVWCQCLTSLPPCGLHLSIGNFVCRCGSVKSNPSIDEPDTTESIQLVAEEVTNDEVALIVETNPS